MVLKTNAGIHAAEYIMPQPHLGRRHASFGNCWAHRLHECMELSTEMQ